MIPKVPLRHPDHGIEPNLQFLTRLPRTDVVMMTAQIRGVDGEGKGLGQVLKDGLGSNEQLNEEPKEKITLVNRAGESRSPYVRAHSSNPVAWQMWGDEAIALARKENRLLFVSIGYSACHCKCRGSTENLDTDYLGCHVMERESFENEEVAAILNDGKSVV